jgi:hypothetical protein
MNVAGGREPLRDRKTKEWGIQEINPLQAVSTDFLNKMP